MKNTASKRILEMKQELKQELQITSDVAFGKLAGADKSVVGQWISGKIKSIAPRYAYNLEDKTGYSARWIMLGNEPKRVHIEALQAYNMVNATKEKVKRRQAVKIVAAIIEQNEPNRDNGDNGATRERQCK